jgi:hypothetical protein
MRGIAGILPVIAAALAAGSGASVAQHAEPAPQELRLSPDLLELLRSEMREITVGVQLVAAAIATGNWDAVHEAGASIRASYIMEKSLTPAQAGELERALPERFKLLDAEFHARAEKLAVAAATRDSELVLFHYSRLLETCTRCHAAFAETRFTGFAPPPERGHAH